jgi:hypothetical protein
VLYHLRRRTPASAALCQAGEGVNVGDAFGFGDVFLAANDCVGDLSDLLSKSGVKPPPRRLCARRGM